MSDRSCPTSSRIALRELADVVAAIAVLRKRGVLAQDLLGARAHRDREVLDLLARVVVVELARDREALRREQAADRVAERGIAAVPDVQGPGRIGRDELDHDPLARMRVRRAERVALGEHARDDRLARRGRQHDVDEAGAGDFRARDDRRRRQRCDDRLRELARIAACRLGERERDVRRVVAVRRLLRPLDRDRRAGVLRQQRGDGRRKRAFEFGLGIVHGRRGQGFVHAKRRIIAGGVSRTRRGPRRAPSARGVPECPPAPRATR